MYVLLRGKEIEENLQEALKLFEGKECVVVIKSIDVLVDFGGTWIESGTINDYTGGAL